MRLTALVKQVTSKALVSGDKSFRIVLETDDPKALEAGTYAGDRTVEVEIKESP